MFTARYVLHSTFCPHSVFMCFVWIWEQTAIISLYSIDWLVFITETVVLTARDVLHSTFCPHSVFMFCVDLRKNSVYFTVQHWLVVFYNWDGVCLLRGTFYILRSAHTAVFMCFVWIWEQTAIISLSSINWLFFTTEMECVYCAVRSAFYVLST